jgi:hypothetical protein
MSGNPNPAQQYTYLADSIVCRRLIVEEEAHLPGGGGPSGGVYTCTGSENENGFPIVFASLTPPIVPPSGGYVAMVQYQSGSGFVIASTAPGGWTPTQISVGTSVPPQAGDTVAVIIVPLP